MAFNLGANLGQGYSSGGSYGYSNGGSVNSGQSMSQGWSQSGTDAMTAREWSMLMSDIAWERDLQAMQMQMDYNSKEAKTEREWQERMANSIYTRSVKNMEEAGINPILAYNMGLSGASVGSGAQASLGGVPNAPVAQNFMDSWSASNSFSNGISNGSSWNSGENSSWNQSENGLVTALTALGSMIGNALDMVTSGSKIDLTLNGLADLIGNNSVIKDVKDEASKIKNNIVGNVQDFVNKLTGHKDNYHGSGGGHSFYADPNKYPTSRPIGKTQNRSIKGRYTK